KNSPSRSRLHLCGTDVSWLDRPFVGACGQAKPSPSRVWVVVLAALSARGMMMGLGKMMRALPSRVTSALER
ncbi:MAG: hypothetical protein OEV76_03865, partial [Anaerolineae bacterium]|nr:hypothetical protein [Anaerolineae bacterium]